MLFALRRCYSVNFVTYAANCRIQGEGRKYLINGRDMNFSCFRQEIEEGGGILTLELQYRLWFSYQVTPLVSFGVRTMR
jgi:hypothetical protein